MPDIGNWSVDELKAQLTSAEPPSGEVLNGALEQLLYHALETRDTDAARVVAGYMDADPSVDTALNHLLNEALKTQPDAVYVFLRTRLADGVDEHWLPRLRAAALCSLDVAINAADSATLSSWLKLIAREPASYQLNDLLNEGIRAARTRAHNSGDLGIELIGLAVKRAPDSLEELLSDPELVAALPDPLGPALREHDPAALEGLQEQGRDVYLVALTDAARAQVSGAFPPTAIQTIWEVYTSGQVLHLPERYRPEAILREWVEHGASWLSNESLELLLTLVLAAERDDLFYQLTHHLGKHEVLFPLLATVLHGSRRSVTNILGLIGQVVAAGDITQQQAVNTYIALLAVWEWQKDVLPLAEQLARMMQQSPALTVTSEVCWHLLNMATEAKNEMLARVATKRLQAYFEGLSEQTELIDQFLSLYQQAQWSPPVRQQIMEWWREFARRQPLATLQQLAKGLEGKRALEEARAAVRTVLSARKLLGKRSLGNFAADVGAAFALLQTLADSFDPPPKQSSVNIDQEILRAELAARDEELSAQERKLLAKNLKELAQTIIAIAENRSKGSIMRRDDELDRQLMTGAEEPQSAIDTLKWLSGYLDGVQTRTEDEAE
jgi:hypothetical protein